MTITSQQKTTKKSIHKKQQISQETRKYRFKSFNMILVFILFHILYYIIPVVSPLFYAKYYFCNGFN